MSLENILFSKKSISTDILIKAKAIKLLICDVDGVLTDGLIYMGNQGEELKAFHVRDGFGIHAIQNAGINVALITGRDSKIVENRAKTLKIEHVFQGQTDKLVAFHTLCDTLAVQANQIAYIGDDLIDLPVMQKVGLSIAVADAHPLLQPQADYITVKEGGKGAVREVCDLILFSQNKLNDIKGLSV